MMSTIFNSGLSVRLILPLALAAVLLRSAGAVPLDALRSIWVVEDDSWSGVNPAHLARQRELHSEFEVGHHLLVRSSDRESATWNISGRQLVPLANSALQLHLQRTGTGWRYLFDDARLSSRPLGQEHLDLAYGRTFGRYLDLGVETRIRPSYGRLEGAAGIRLYPWNNWVAEAYARRSSADQLSVVRFEEEQIDLQSRGYYTRQGLALQGSVFPRLHVALRGQWSALEPGRAKDGYTLEMDGRWRLLQGSWQGKLHPRFSLVGDLRYRDLEGGPAAHLQGKRFSRGQVHLEDVAGAMWLRYRPGRNHCLDLGYIASRGQGRVQQGRLESWPFVSSFASLLGGKDWSFRGDADFRLDSVGLRFQQRSRAWKAGTDIRLFHARGHLHAISRERTKLNFGSLFFPKIYQEKRRVQVDAIDLRMSATYQPSEWGVRYSLAQIIPLRVHIDPSLDSVEREASGGRQHRLLIVFSPAPEP